MCGIIGVVGIESAPLVALKMCKQQDSRGTDATGVSYVTKDGRIVELKKAITPENYLKTYADKLAKLKNITIAVAHNRQATCNIEEKHMDKECHPFMAEDGSFTLMQNGMVPAATMISNYLEFTGHKFSSGVDSEILTHLLEDIIEHSKDRDDAFEKFKHVYVGNVIVMFSDGEMWGLASTSSFSLIVTKTSVFMASEIDSILKVLNDYSDKAVAMGTSGDSSIRVLKSKDNNETKFTIKKHGDWSEYIIKDGEWVCSSIGCFCDFCRKANKRCQKFKVGDENKDRCYDCFKAGITTVPEVTYANVHNSYNSRQSMGFPTSVDPCVDNSHNLTVVCHRCKLPHTNMDSIVCKHCKKAFCRLCFSKHNCGEKEENAPDDIVSWLYEINAKQAQDGIED